METINDIVAEMRIGDLCAEDTSVTRPAYINDFLVSYADRIEAAAMREREAGAEASQICGEIGEIVGGYLKVYLHDNLIFWAESPSKWNA